MVREQRKPDLDRVLNEVMWLFLGGIARPEALAVLNREEQKLSGKQGVERGESPAVRRVGSV